MAKHGKKRKMVKEDLISRLPNSVLTHILSFVDTKSAVTTTLLSKRWNRLWILVPNLDFGGGGWSRADGYTGTQCQSVHFVNRVLKSKNVVSVRNVCLDDFGQSLELDRRNSWLASIAKRNAERIKLSFPFCQVYCLPGCYFNQSNLVELRLAYFSSPISQSVCFPCLKVIEFEGFRLSDEESFKNLMIGCPVLEDLYINTHEWNVGDTLYISSNTLRKLALYVVEDVICHVVIDATNVTTLSVCEYNWGRYDIRDLSSLVSFIFSLRGDLSIESWQLLRKISHVREMYLALHDEIDGEFCSLEWDEPTEVPSCFSSCLESIKVPVIYGEDHEMPMISYILKNATVLKKLYIIDMNSRDLKRENKFLKALLNLERSSAACQVSYDHLYREDKRMI